jgi:hypothetical protein
LNADSNIDTWSTDKLAWEINDLAAKIPTRKEILNSYLRDLLVTIPLYAFTAITQRQAIPSIPEILFLVFAFVSLAFVGYFRRRELVSRLKSLENQLDERLRKRVENAEREFPDMS